MTPRGTLSRAGSWLAHPVSIVALIVMILNDHYLKQSYGSWWTGKLSDAAGLVFFPALLALIVALVAPRLAWRGVVVASVSTTALGFVWVKATAVGAATASGLLSQLAGPSLVRADLTDLLALPMLGLAAWIAFREPIAARWRVIAALPIAVLATAATSQDTSIPGVISVQEHDGDVVVARSYVNHTAELISDDWWTAAPGGDFLPRRIGDGALPKTPGLTLDCLAWEPTTCYRVYQHHLGVERSTDSGVTWTVDWEVPDVQREALGEQIQTYGEYEAGDLSYIETVEVAVVGDASGYWVYAANGVDGVSMRHPDGTWERIGSPGYQEWYAATPLPAILDTQALVPTYAGTLVAAFAAVVGALAIGGVVVFAPNPGSGGRTTWSVGALFSWVPLIALLFTAYDFAYDLAQPAVIGVQSLALVLIPAAICVLLMAFGMWGAQPKRGLEGLGLVAAVTVVTGSLAALMPLEFSARVVIGAVLAAVLSGVLAVFARRRVSTRVTAAS